MMMRRIKKLYAIIITIYFLKSKKTIILAYGKARRRKARLEGVKVIKNLIQKTRDGYH